MRVCVTSNKMRVQYMPIYYQLFAPRLSMCNQISVSIPWESFLKKSI